ncbi:unnamed protein product [Pelagomonas calceolata]|uniref:Uncharacterized protein n=2 Tax=Pelagomonas calceolata TaxID=35677 RepID=A0A8J2SEE4_9STRA|nr:unnamed protein product [Pelagomonas calceolata]
MAAPAPLGDVTASRDAATNAMASETTEAAAAAVLKPQPSTEDAVRAAAAAPAPSLPAAAPPEATPDWWPPVDHAAPAPAPAVPDPFTTVCMQPAFDADGVECDTAACEDLDITATLLGPWNGRLPTKEDGVHQFGCSYDGALLDAWVKQPSPCCAAAAVAGAINGLSGLHRHDDNALGPLDVLAAMRGVLRDLVESKIASFERKLGADLAPVLDAVASRVSSDGRKFGISLKKDKETGVDGKYLLACVRLEVEARAEACRRAVQRQRALELGEEVSEEEEEAPALAFCRLWELYEELNEKKRKLAEEAGEDDESSDESDEDEEPDEDLPKKTKPARPRQRIAAARKAAKPWNWKNELGEILRKADGVAKTCASRPSTAPFGNWGLIKGAQRLREDARRAAREAEVQALIEDADDATAPVSSNEDERQLPTRTSLGFLGLPQDTLFGCPKAPPTHVVISLLAGGGRAKIPIPLKRDDSDEVIERQWGKLSAAFNRPDASLIFHLKNHYALIYALREWTSDGKRVRQLLCARKGQRPSAWVDWLEARETILGWAGYKLMVAERCSLFS